MMSVMPDRNFITSSPAYRYLAGLIDRYHRFMHSPSRLRRGISFAVFSCIAFFAALCLFQVTDPYPLKGWIYLRLTLEDLGIAGAIIFVFLISILPLISPLSLLIITGAASFGPVPGMVLSYIGSLINANIAFLLVKALGIEHRWGHEARAARIKESIQRNGYPIVLLLQAATIFPFIAINSAAAAAGVDWKDFMKATSLGILPSIMIYSFLGEALVSRFLSPQVYFSLIIMVVLTIFTIAMRKQKIRLRRKRIK